MRFWGVQVLVIFFEKNTIGLYKLVLSLFQLLSRCCGLNSCMMFFATFAALISVLNMVLPIFAYGQPVLKRVAAPITADYAELDALIKNMWETMYYANGVGLAAPQIGLSIRLFVIDTVQLEAKERIQGPGMKRVFINAQKIDETGAPWVYEEGCLSIPNVRGDVSRPRHLAYPLSR